MGTRAVSRTFAEFCSDVDESLTCFILVVRENDPERLSVLLDTIKETTDCADVKLRALLTFFNSEPATSAFKLKLLEAIGEYANKVNLFDLAVYPSVNLDWLDAYTNCADEEKARVALLYADLLAPHHPADSLSWRLKGLQLTAEKKNKDVAELLAANLRLPNQYSFDDLLHLRAVKAVAAEQEIAPLVQMCEALYSGNSLDDVRTVFTKHEAAMVAHRLNLEVLEKKILVALLAEEASKAVAEGKNVLPIDDLVKAIPGTTPAMIEEAAASAICAKLMVAKINHLQNSVAVTSAMPRHFGTNQWKDLKNRLIQWKETIQALQAN